MLIDLGSKDKFSFFQTKFRFTPFWWIFSCWALKHTSSTIFTYYWYQNSRWHLKLFIINYFTGFLRFNKTRFNHFNNCINSLIPNLKVYRKAYPCLVQFIYRQEQIARRVFFIFPHLLNVNLFDLGILFYWIGFGELMP